MLLGIMGASGLLGKRNLKGIEMDLGFPQEVYAGRPFTLAIHLRNTRKRLPLFLARISVGERSVLFPFVDNVGESVAYVPYSFSSRGAKRIDLAYLVSTFPFSFFVRATRLSIAREVLVFPEPLECDIDRVWRDESGRQRESSKGGLGDSSELASIREYVTGDPLKYVNWKATAKTGALKTTLFGALSQRPALIDFEKVEIRGIEEKISSVTFAILALMKDNIPVGLRFGDHSFPPALSDSHRYTIMKELALYDQSR